MTFSSHLYRANPMVVNSISKVLHLVGCRERETAVVQFWDILFRNLAQKHPNPKQLLGEGEDREEVVVEEDHDLANKLLIALVIRS